MLLPSQKTKTCSCRFQNTKTSSSPSEELVLPLRETKTFAALKKSKHARAVTKNQNTRPSWFTLVSWPWKRQACTFNQTTKKAYDTQYSQPVTHVSTNWARRSLTSEIGRDRVFSTWYGRKREKTDLLMSNVGERKSIFICDSGRHG